MAAQDFYYTIDSKIRAPELKVKGSRFIADLLPATTKQEIEANLASVRKEFHDATHHCFAYRLGADAQHIRAADDGEPSGTAGKPILLILTSQQITDALLVVTRYYGGTKLGTGGLARAYAEAAQSAVAMAKIVKVFLLEAVLLRVQYEDLPGVERLIQGFEGKIESVDYTESVSLRVSVRRSIVNEFLHSLVDSFHGRVEQLPVKLG